MVIINRRLNRSYTEMPPQCRLLWTALLPASNAGLG